MIKYIINFKIIFHFYNISLIFLYIYPGSFLGCYVYNDCNFDLQITKDFFISSNHFYALAILTFLGILAFNDPLKIKFLWIYLIFISIILELLHHLIPVRVFQLSDLLGNIFGVILIIMIYYLRKK